MATFREIMDAASNADAAGDTDAAARLVEIARGMVPKDRVAEPQDVAGTGNLTPKAYDPSEDVGTKRPDRFGDTIDAATKQPREAFMHYAGGALDSDKPAIERAKDAGLAALSAAGTTYAFGAGLAGEVLGGSPTNEKKLARDLMMMGEVSVPELAGVTSGATAANRVARNAAKLDKPATDVQRTARAADELGITPALGSSGKVSAQVAAGLEKVPFSGGVIARDAARYVDEVERAFDAATAKVGTVKNAEGAGAALQAGANKFVQDFKKKSGELFDNVSKAIPKGTQIEAPATVAMIRDAIAPYADKPALRKQLGLDKWAAIADDLESGLSWEAASSLRTSIGESVGRINGALADMDQGKLKLAYGKLTEDLEAAAKASGPEAEKAWRRANSYYRRGAERIESALDKTIKADSPERAFEAFARMAKGDKSTSDIRRMYQIKASIPENEWATVSASIIDRLGRAPSGAQNASGDVFSPGKFLTEWNNLSKEAKSILLSPASRKEMDLLADVAHGVKRTNAERNFSNTGTATGILATLMGAGVDMGATATALAGANLSARAFTSQRFLRALNNAARGDLKQLRAIERGGSPFAQDAATILRITAAEAAATGGAANNNSAARRQATP